MKRFIVKIVVFALPVILLLLAVEIFYRVVPNNYSFKNDKLIESFDNTEVLILGSSHTFYGINPAYLSRPAFNLAEISQTIYFDKLLFDKYLNRFDKLKYLVLNVEYTSLSQVDNTDEDVWRKYYYEKYMNLEVPLISKLDYQRYLLSSTKSFNFNINLIKSFLKNRTIVTCDDKGFGVDYTKQNKDLNFKKYTKEVVRRHEDGLSDFSLNTQRLQEIIGKCHKKNIKIVLLITPVCKEYAFNVNQIKWHKIVSNCNQLSTKNKDVYFLNLFQDSRFTNDDLFDSDHLNTDGAKKCSLIVNSLFIDK